MKEIYLSDKEWSLSLDYHMSQGYKITQSKQGRQSYHIKGQGIHKKYVNLKYTRIWSPSFAEGHEYIMLPGQAARETLKHYYPDGYTCPRRYEYLKLNQPEWVERWTKGYENMVYIDIKSAYLQIYAKLNLDQPLSTSPNLKCSFPLLPVAQELYDWKEARNGVPGLMYSNMLYVYQFGELQDIYFTKSKYYNPCVWVLINRILHEIAYFARKCGAIYIATDGYLIPLGKGDYSAMKRLLNSVGLRYRMYVGKTSLKKWGCYDIQGVDENGQLQKKRTRPFEQYVEWCNSPENKGLSWEECHSQRDKMIRKTRRNGILRIGGYHYLKWWASLPSVSLSLKEDRTIKNISISKLGEMNNE